ncbi:MAG: hypothetical protein NUV87_04500 [Candidatus Roizmanbacteria bacterium]|nr:hypothetical protein [Candidatus Roizmanbacteria bacterium]MCR4313053.1 hypothetical protein [Candidatus Roizmanbacteria bacterium]
MKEKSMHQSDTVLEKIGITNSIVSEWKKMGLKITYPMKVNKFYYKSQDGNVFVEAADRYVPLLSKKELAKYIRSPKKFKDDFLHHVSFYFNFHIFLYKKSLVHPQLCSDEEKMTIKLTLMYLFLSAMDHHYYHFDRYLVYQDYPDTPVGYWWLKLKNFYYEVFKEKVTRKSFPINFLRLLSYDENILREFNKNLTKVKLKNFKKAIKAIKMFEEVQQKEVKIITGYPEKENLLFKSGFGLWNNICKEIKTHPGLILKKNRKKILQLIEGHPISSTRKLLESLQLNVFNKKIMELFQAEAERWTS